MPHRCPDCLSKLAEVNLTVFSYRTEYHSALHALRTLTPHLGADNTSNKISMTQDQALRIARTQSFKQLDVRNFGSF